MEREPDRSRWLSPTAALTTAALAVLAFHAAYQWPIAGGLVVIYLACLYCLAWVPTTRWAFYLGLAIGFLVAAPQLRFLVGIFGPAAVGLWLALGLWLSPDRPRRGRPLGPVRLALAPRPLARSGVLP